MLEVSAVRLHACTKMLAPLVNCIVNGALVDIKPQLLQMLFQFVSVVHPRLVHSLLDDTTDPVINRIKVRAVRWPKSRRCLLEKSHSVSCSVCWGTVLLKDEEFHSPDTSRIICYLQRIFNNNQKLNNKYVSYVQ